MLEIKQVQQETDPYWKLRAEAATPPAEVCQCPDDPPIVLQDHLSPVPLACIRCNGEVPPERIGFSAELAEQLASWRNLHRALFTLWLDSAEYESWSRLQLEDPGGRVNIRGLQAVSELNKHRRAYYWWFQDNADEHLAPRSDCPRCQRALTEYVGRLVCNPCSILVAKE